MERQRKNIMQRRQILRWACGLAGSVTSISSLAQVAQSELVWRERALLGFGTTLWIKAAHADTERVELALDAAVRAIRDVERQMSLFDPESALQRLNARGFLSKPEPALLEVMTLSREIARRSGGSFDVSMQALWLAWQKAAQQGELPSERVLRQARQRVNWRALEISADRLRLNVRGMQLSLNGIAQGYAADRARAALMAHGIAHAMIDAGETTLLGEAPDRQAWAFGIEDAVSKRPPANAHPSEHAIPIVQSDGRAMATSSDAHTSFSADHRHHHILDPRTGYSPTYWASVTVIATRCVVADALTKVFFMLPPSRVLAMARAWDVDVVLQDKAGQWRASPGAKARLPMA